MQVKKVQPVVSIPSNDWTVNNELERMWEEATTAYFKVLSRYSVEGTK
jgi:hypothetical protein